MRSIAFTLLLLATALVAGGLALVNLREGTLARLIGAPATPVGETLYEFDPRAVHDIILSSNGVTATCSFVDGRWQVVRPSRDMMDPRIVGALVGFTLTAEVQGAIPIEKIDSRAVNFNGNQIGVRLQDAKGEPLAKYILRTRAAWVGTDPESGASLPTVYVEPRDRSRKDYIYVCTDRADILGVLGEGFKRLRDHHPFLLPPAVVQQLESIRLKNRSGELTLSRKAATDPWNISKPIDLRADPAEVTTLVQGLINLTAVNVRDRSELTLPGEDAITEQIALGFFRNEQPIVLNIYPPPPETPQAPTVLATVSDRPNAVFELPRRKAAAPNGSPGLADLPQSVNELRDPTLLAVDPTALRAVLISPAAGEDILVVRENPGSRPRVRIGQSPEAGDPNEDVLFALLQTITDLRVAAFVTDAASDLAPYGLDAPKLILSVFGFDNSRVDILFGGPTEDGERIYATRKGSSTVVEVERSILGQIATKAPEWRDTRLWAIDKTRVQGITRTLAGGPPLELLYNDFAGAAWTARQGTTDLTGRLSTDRANIFLQNLLDLRASYWLPPDHEEANQALVAPTMVLEMAVRSFDREGNPSGIAIRRLTIASVTRGTAQVHYARIEGEPNPFLLSAKSAGQLSVDLLAEDE